MGLMPLFGGAAYIWNAAQLFFQCALLLGYGYAFALSRIERVRRQLILHGGVAALALLFLPLAIEPGDMSAYADAPVYHILLLLMKDVGAPFFLLASTASLLQYWLARGFGIDEPYGLYRASNAGSFLGLLSYPLLVQPWLALDGQMAGWSLGFVAFLGCLWWCGRKYAKGAALPAHAPALRQAAEKAAAAALRPIDRLWWLALAFGPVGLLMAVNTHITVDIPSFPLIWVMPLALYLLSFVWGFAAWHRYALWTMLALQAVTVAAVLTCTVFQVRMVLGHGYLLLLMAGFFLTALVCHHELFRRRPPKERLTEYYLFISLGGFLAGAFNVLLVPVLFPVPVELPLMLLVCLLIRPEVVRVATMRQVLLFLIVPALLLVGLLLFSVADAGVYAPHLPRWGVAVIGGVLLLFVLAYSGTRFALTMVLAGLYMNAEGRYLRQSPYGELVHSHRNFYGVTRVFDVAAPFHYRALHHGTTLHGIQALGGEDSLEPTTYYHRSTPVADAISFRQRQSEAIRVGLIGVGTGTLKCYGRPADHFRFFEIDRDMAALAENPRYFTYLSACPGSHDVVIGDGRIRLSEEPDGSYDVIVADAFSSDSIPIHLLTREAVAMYMRKLRPGGVLMVHVSNRYMDLSRVVAGIARSLDLEAHLRRARILRTDPLQMMLRDATWIAVTRDRDTAAELIYFSDREWTDLRREPNPVVWRDDYASLLPVIRW